MGLTYSEKDVILYFRRTVNYSGYILQVYNSSIFYGDYYIFDILNRFEKGSCLNQIFHISLVYLAAYSLCVCTLEQLGNVKGRNAVSFHFFGVEDYSYLSRSSSYEVNVCYIIYLLYFILESCGKFSQFIPVVVFSP